MFIVCLFTIPIAKTAVQLRETDDKRAAKLMNDLKFQTSTMILCLLVIALDTFIGTLINGYQIMFLTCIDAYVFGSSLFFPNQRGNDTKILFLYISWFNTTAIFLTFKPNRIGIKNMKEKILVSFSPLKKIESKSQNDINGEVTNDHQIVPVDEKQANG